MTQEQAIAEVERRQRLHPDAKWVATCRAGEWEIARIGLAPSRVEMTGTATQPAPVARREDPYSELENVTRFYGTIG